MTKYLLLPVVLVCFCVSVFADKGKNPKKKDVSTDSLEQVINRYYLFQDSVNQAIKYETGRINLSQGNATLNVPSGFKFVNTEQANFVITKVWGNPQPEHVLGILFPESSTPFTDSSFAFVVSYDPMGYVKDDDAKDINYDDMMADMQKSEAEENRDREAAGYEPIHIEGWAQKPFYDQDKKILHWAKNIKFGDAERNTLNYDVRVLGRNGILSLNAVASVTELPLVKKNIDKVLSMARFTPGYTYADYKSGTDKVAIYTIGGLVAGKVLAKVGFFALLAKFSKLIIAAVVGAFVFIKKKFTGRSKSNENDSSEALVTENGNLP